MNIRVKLDRSYNNVVGVVVVGLFFKFLQKVHDRSWSMIGHHQCTRPDEVLKNGLQTFAKNSTTTTTTTTELYNHLFLTLLLLQLI